MQKLGFFAQPIVPASFDQPENEEMGFPCFLNNKPDNKVLVPQVMAITGDKRLHLLL